MKFDIEILCLIYFSADYVYLKFVIYRIIFSNRCHACVRIQKEFMQNF